MTEPDRAARSCGRRRTGGWASPPPPGWFSAARRGSFLGAEPGRRRILRIPLIVARVCKTDLVPNFRAEAKFQTRCVMKNQTNRMLRANGMLIACLGGALALSFAAAPALADDQPTMPSTAKSRTMHETVTVTGIEKSTRTLTVKSEGGETHSLTVPAEVKSFDKLKKGDKIDIDYTESVAVSMLPPGSKPSASERSAMGRTGQGEGMAGKQVTVSAEVLEVDPANNKVVFKGPKGNAKVVNVQSPEMQAKLPSLKPGQVVQFTYTESVALAIQPRK